LEIAMTATDAERLGKLLATARARAGMSTIQLALGAGINQSNVVRLEQGRIARPKPELLQRLAEALDLPLNELYAVAGVPLPRLQPYLRASYGLSAQDAARAQAYIERLAAGDGADGRGPSDGADEVPITNT
jgi:transcriptional regulator with XRE-family HTH domain